MNWQPIDTAPKDGTTVVLWCQSAQSLLMECRLENGVWKEWSLGHFDSMGWNSLESYEIPTHWLRITPPSQT